MCTSSLCFYVYLHFVLILLYVYTCTSTHVVFGIATLNIQKVEVHVNAHAVCMLPACFKHACNVPVEHMHLPNM